ncbi:BspA family leucine-rich repeat surface protein [Allomuricauda sp. F6463D]|uniref:BspA family leucine-rich repeat surface protein n=1 Tax=Allomuricauda sp. F6463D TaxID=2926409 RepID=UPI001FF0E299|nr:BspA family leucine-rich repeat surface protein [Muricauda sp. F6463D]MCK0159718.1 BspA family leucine-rich repeat surface protein [Muricauda sp. F6463D]
MRKLPNKLGTIIMALVLLWSCGKDDGPSVASNEAPTMADQVFQVDETITDAETIGKVAAADADEDVLTFSIITNDSDLFSITKEGVLSLATGKSLDFSNAVSHKITVKVSDGEEDASATITINVGDINEVPVFGEESYAFEALEDISDTDAIGTVTATDGDGDTLEYTLTTNDNDLFEINAEGELSLADGKELDFETAEEHVLTVTVTDGTESVDATITITVANVIESMFEDPASFITTWEVPENNFILEIGTNDNFDYDFTIDWGDGTIEQLVDLQDPTHVYETAGTYTVAIQGFFPSIKMQDNASRIALKSIDQWGAIVWQTFNYAFLECVNMEYLATDVPDLSQVSDLTGMFFGAESFNGDISSWDVSNVTDMPGVFYSANSFNGDISSWDVSNVINMTGMFYNAESFNGDISSWDVSNVTDLDDMFNTASSFNGDISSWDVSSVTVMSRMFNKATSFDQNLGAWYINSVATMKDMFDGSGLSPQNFTATLVGWEAADNTPDNITLGAENIQLCSPEVLSAYASLINNHNWDIDFDGIVICN